MTTDDEIMARIMATIAAALGRPFPQTESPPSRAELLYVASICAGAAEMASALADAVERWEPTQGASS